MMEAALSQGRDVLGWPSRFFACDPKNLNAHPLCFDQRCGLRQKGLHGAPNEGVVEVKEEGIHFHF
jgi:hypothetical protein